VSSAFPPLAAANVIITHELQSRPVSEPDYLREKAALQDLAAQMVESPAGVLPRLVTLAMALCSADSAGVSLLSADASRFTWLSVCGRLARFEGTMPPRDNSPSAVSHDSLGPVLMERPERAYTWMREAGMELPEMLLVPLMAPGQTALGTLWAVAGERGRLNRGHVRVLTELASCAAIALTMIRAEERLTVALREQEMLAKEMSHRVKNLFTVIDVMVRMMARTATTPRAMADALSGRIHALASAHGLVRRTFFEHAVPTTSLDQLVPAILLPHGGTHRFSGPPVVLGQHAASNIALVLHELATNATKYGALSLDGQVNVEWSVIGEELRINWAEERGPEISTVPDRKGFGTLLAETTVNNPLGGTITYDWNSLGLRVVIAIPTDRLQH